MPRVFIYASTFFMIKLAAYTMLLWLPTWLQDVYGYDNTNIANTSSCYDAGAIFGSIILGYISDKLYSRRAPVAMFGVICAIITSYSMTFTFLNYNQA